MLGVSPGALKWQTAPQTTIEFASLPQFDAALRAFVDEQQEKYRATADALVARDLMAPEEADESLPELELNLIDMRGEGAVPIPKTPDLPSRLEWFSPGTP
jgi:hypothetical protein